MIMLERWRGEATSTCHVVEWAAKDLLQVSSLLFLSMTWVRVDAHQVCFTLFLKLQGWMSSTIAALQLASRELRCERECGVSFMQSNPYAFKCMEFTHVALQHDEFTFVNAVEQLQPVLDLQDS